MHPVRHQAIIRTARRAILDLSWIAVDNDVPEAVVRHLQRDGTHLPEFAVIQLVLVTGAIRLIVVGVHEADPRGYAA